MREDENPRKKRITFKEVLDAIRQNGLPKEKGEFFRFEETKDSSGNVTEKHAVAACALGQAAINLGVYAPDLYDSLNITGGEEDYVTFGENIAAMNDATDSTFEEIADFFEQEKEYLDYVFYVEKEDYKVVTKVV